MIFSERPKEKVDAQSSIIIGGILESGLGEGAKFIAMEEYSKRIHSTLGYLPFPGTLNIRIIDSEDRSAWNKILRTIPLVIPEFVHDRRKYGMVHLWPASVLEPKILSPPQVTILRPLMSIHTEVFEIISPECLRTTLGLQDGTRMTFKVTELGKI